MTDLPQNQFAERLKTLIKLLRVQASDFATALGVKPQALSGYTGARGSKPSFETLEKILLTYPRVDAHWLLTGQGEPLRPAGATASTTNGHAVATSGDGNTVHVGNLDDCRHELAHWQDRARLAEELAQERKARIDLLTQTK